MISSLETAEGRVKSGKHMCDQAKPIHSLVGLLIVMDELELEVEPVFDVEPVLKDRLLKIGSISYRARR